MSEPYDAPEACQRVRNELEAAVANPAADRPQSLETHLATCPDCRKRIEAAKAFDGAVRATQAEDAEVDLDAGWERLKGSIGVSEHAPAPSNVVSLAARRARVRAVVGVLAAVAAVVIAVVFLKGPPADGTDSRSLLGKAEAQKALEALSLSDEAFTALDEPGRELYHRVRGDFSRALETSSADDAVVRAGVKLWLLKEWTRAGPLNVGCAEKALATVNASASVDLSDLTNERHAGESSKHLEESTQNAQVTYQTCQ